MRFNIQYSVLDVTEEINDILNSKFVRLNSAFRDVDLALKSDNLILFREKLEVIRSRVREFDLRLKDSEEIIKGYMEHLMDQALGDIQEAKEIVEEVVEKIGEEDDNKIG